MFSGGVGLAMVLGFISLFVKLSFGAWVVIWIVLMIVFAFVEESEKQEKKELSETKKCSMCAEKIQLTAKKCRFCNELQP